MKKRGQCLSSQFATKIEMQRCKVMQWPNPLQQPSVSHFDTREYRQFLKSATHQWHDASANSEWQLNYSSLAGVLITLCTTILKTKNCWKFNLWWISSVVPGKQNITVTSKGNNHLLYLIISPFIFHSMTHNLQGWTEWWNNKYFIMFSFPGHLIKLCLWFIYMAGMVNFLAEWCHIYI